MVTELLERIVIRCLDEHSLTYSILRHNVVEIGLSTDEGNYRALIADHEFEEPLLQFGVTPVARFPENQVAYALIMCNKINRLAVGKFAVHEDGAVCYYLEYPISDSAQPDDVLRMLSFATKTLDKFYPAIMTVRWANATVEQALERQDDGGPGTPILSDEQIRRLLEGNGAERDDSEE